MEIFKEEGKGKGRRSPFVFMEFKVHKDRECRDLCTSQVLKKMKFLKVVKDMYNGVLFTSMDRVSNEKVLFCLERQVCSNTLTSLDRLLKNLNHM